MDVSALREEYSGAGLRRVDLHADPVVQFELWFEQARKAGLHEPNAMALATAAMDGQPSLRTVLMKAFDRSGIIFFTNYGSRKARELEANPKAALLFMWLPLERQVKVRGQVEKVSAAERYKYFHQRPRGSQLGAWVSDQSSVISSRAILEKKFAEMERTFAEGEIPLPDSWGGYRVVPDAFEFWQGGRDRLHDHFCYSRQPDGSWKIDRLAP